jgi:tetratricopeptide (TPR) repeat protein
VNYRTIGSSIVLMALTALAIAGQEPSKKRLDAIWNAVDTRVSNQIDTWYKDGDYPKAIHMLVWESTYAPHDYDVATNLGWMEENVEDWDAALATYRLYLKNNPQDRDAALPEAQYYFLVKHDYAKVPALLEPTLNRKPHPNVFRILAHSYEKLKKFKDAERVWQALVAQDPKDGAAKVNLAKVEKRLTDSKDP